jgi:hypothetical protein
MEKQATSERVGHGTVYQLAHVFVAALGIQDVACFSKALMA